MVPQYLLEILDDMGVETAGLSLDLVLGNDGVGMDSQEVIELYGRVRRTLGVTLPLNSLKRTTRLGEVVELLDTLLVVKTG